MNLAKILAGAALVAAPLSLVSGQSSTPADSGAHGTRAGWLTGAGSVAGAGIFLAFTHAAHNGGTNAGVSAFHAPQTTPADPSVPTRGLTPSPAGASTPTTTPDQSTPSDTTSTVKPPPSNDGPVGPVNDGPIAPVKDGPAGPTDDGPFLPTTNDGPTTNHAASFMAESSTVPEPGTLALTATGIIGLVPLIRRRRR